MLDDRRRALELYTETMIRVILPLTSTRTAFTQTMQDPTTAAIAAELRRDHPDLADRLRAACQERRFQLQRDENAGFVNAQTTFGAPR